MHFFKVARLKFRFQLISSIGGLALFIGLTLSLTSYELSKSAIRDVMTSEIVETAHTGLRQIHTWLNSLQSELQWGSEQSYVIGSITDTRKEKNGSYDLALRQVRRLLADRKELEKVIIANAQGMTVVAADPSLVGKFNISDRDYFKRAMEGGKPVVSEAFESKVSHRPVVVLAHPIIDDGKITGVLCATVSLFALYDRYLSTIHPGGSGYAFLMDSKGMIIVHPDASIILKVNASDVHIGQEMVLRKQGVFHYTFKQVKKTAAFDTDSISGWTLAVTLNDDEVLASAAASLNASLLMDVLFTAIGICVAWWITNLVTSKLGKDPDEPRRWWQKWRRES